MSFGVLGRLEVRDPDGTQLKPLPPRQREILCLLLLRANTFVSTAALADELWSLPLTESRQRALWVSVSRLREALGADPGGGPIFTQSGGYRLEVSVEQVDALLFERRVSRGIELARERPAQAVRELAAAEALWRDRAYADLEFEELFAAEADRLHQLRATAREHRLDAELALGRHHRVLDEITPHALEDLFREPTQRIYLVALWRSGRTVEARRHYDRLWEQLRAGGLEPGPELQDLYDRMLAQDPDLGPPAERPVAPAPPGGDGVGGAARGGGRAGLPPGAVIALEGPPFVAGAGVDVVAGIEAGRAPVVVVRGEAGSGKSRLAAELVRRHHARDEAVLWGRAVAGRVAPYQAFVDALDPLLALAPGEDAREVLVAGAGPGGSVRSDLAEAIVARLREATAATDVVLVIDDLQWVGDDGLALWLHLARSRIVGLTLVATLRGGDPATVGEPGWLVELRHRGGGAVVDLSGLRAAAVEELAGHLGRKLRPGEAEALVARTAGNAFYLVAALREPPGPPGAPAPAAVLAGFDRLPGDCRRLLEVAALAGREFRLADVAGPAGAADPHVTVAPALDAGLVRPVAGAGDGTLVFCHDIVRDAVRDRLDEGTRAAIHRELGLDIEAHADRQRRAAQLAAHFLAGTGEDLDRVSAYSMVAADEARRAAAHADAAFHYRRALDATALARPGDRLERCRLLVLEGEACRAAYDSARARRSLVEAVTLALELHEDELLDRAVTELIWVHEFGDAPDDTPRLVSRARRLPDQSPVRRALFATARARLASLPAEETMALLDEGEALAREAGDDHLLGLVLHTSCLQRWWVGTAEWRDRVALQIRDLGRRAGAREMELDSYRLHASARLELGDFHSSVEGVRQFINRAAGSGRPNFDAGVGHAENSIDLLQGRFATAEARLPRLLDGVGESANFLAAYGLQLYHLRREQGRAAETLSLLRQLLDDGHYPALRVPLAVAELELGHTEVGRDELDRAVAAGLDAIPRDWLWMGIMAGVAESAHLAGHAKLAAQVHDRIAPFAGNLVVLAHNVLCLGSAQRYVGLAAVAAGRHDEGIEHLHEAIRVDDGLGAWPALARDHLALGRALSPASPGPADGAGARLALEEARRRGGDYGMPLVRAAAEDELNRL